ncbi:hypothetical protein HDV04_000996 [Boothiomyces sp. JEL0838]|nr:hypothetical protein HDV04_000996 [Boothiomyces sp. JEL0838]
MRIQTDKVTESTTTENEQGSSSSRDCCPNEQEFIFEPIECHPSSAEAACSDSVQQVTALNISNFAMKQLTFPGSIPSPELGAVESSSATDCPQTSKTKLQAIANSPETTDSDMFQVVYPTKLISDHYTIDESKEYSDYYQFLETLDQL